MKKFFITLLAALSCMLTIAAFGCQTTTDGQNNAPQNYTVEFTPTENLTYICDELEEGETSLSVKSGTIVAFSIEVPALYATPAVYSNGVRITDSDGVYSVTVLSNVKITTSTVNPATSSMSGSGTESSPLLVTKPVDLLAIASYVNSGYGGYSSAYYSLENDLDFGGAEISVIGDGSSDAAVFMGNFNGNGHTISNFSIKTEGVSNVGLFGYIMSSGLGDATGVVANLNLDNFEIEATANAQQAMFVGSLVGYNLAGTVMACSATNGSIYVSAAREMFSFIGGAVGYQQSAVISSGTSISYFTASASYVYTDVDIDCDGGVLAAGGVVGYVASEQERAISFVIDSYSTGNVFGAIYSGGVAGYVSDYSSVANCYSLSEVYANARYQDNEIFSHAYAGGLIGYIGNNAIVSDCFATGNAGGQSASGNSYVHSDELLGGREEAVPTLNEGLFFNCYTGDDVKTTSAFFKDTLHWQECDWVITATGYPVINMEEAQVNNFVVTFDFSSENTVNGSHKYELNISLSETFYSPVFYFYDENFGESVVSEEGNTSYGYFFDEAHTQRVPNGFIPTRNITLYAGFADYSQVAGVYKLVSQNKGVRDVTLTLNTDGTYAYDDGILLAAMYFYDGENSIIFNDSLFARLSGNVAAVNDNLRPDLNYSTAKFVAKLTAAGLEIYDGSFFTEEKPLKANRYALSGEWHAGADEYVFNSDFTGTFNKNSFTYTLTDAGVLTVTLESSVKTGTVSGENITIDSTPLTKYDVFKGVWEKSATVNKRYEFDGKGGWTYRVKGAVVSSGTYTVGGNGVATLASGLTAEIDASGLLLVKKNGEEELFSRTNSLNGVWVDSENDLLLYLDGYGTSETGDALLDISGTAQQLKYVLDGFFDGDDGVKHITLLNGYSLFGYLTIDSDGTLSGNFYSAQTGNYLTGYTFYLVDMLDGEWVGEGTLGGVNFDSLTFDGMGLYEGGVSLNGGENAAYSLDGNFDAVFAGGDSVEYKVEYDDENDVITVTSGVNSVSLYRKDELGSYVLIDKNGVTYAFNGGGKLSKGGKLTIKDGNGALIAGLGYKITSGSFAELNTVVELYSEFRGTTSVGSITIKNYKFEFSYTGAIEALSDQTLTIDNPFTGAWAVSDWAGYPIIIDKLDLSNSVSGNFIDMDGTVTFNYLPEYGCMYISYITGEMTSATPLYLIMLSEGNMVVSSYTAVTAGDTLIYCAPRDEYSGEWTNDANSSLKLTFDGMADSSYTLGIARNEMQAPSLYSRRFGQIFYWADNGDVYTLRKDSNATGANVYYKTARNRFVMEEFDTANPVLTATDGSVEYKIYLDGSIEVDGVKKTYNLIVVRGDETDIVILENGGDETGARVRVNHKTNTVTAID